MYIDDVGFGRAAPAVVSGRPGLVFDGKDDYVQTPLSNVPKDGTVEAWVKTTSNVRQSVFSSLTGGEFRLQVNYKPGTAGNSPGFLGVNVRFGTLVAYTDIGKVLYDGSWHHVAFVWEGGTPGTIRIYWDGQEKTVTYTVHGDWAGNSNRTGLHAIGREGVSAAIASMGPSARCRAARLSSSVRSAQKGEWQVRSAGYWAMGLLSLGFLAAVAAGDDPNSKMQPFTFVQVCDPQLGFGGYDHDKETFRQAVRRINALKPDFVVICGDLVNSFSDQSAADFLEINRGFTMPSYCVLGNHDAGEPPTAATLSRYCAALGKDYYSVEHKGYTFVFANTEFWKTQVEVESAAHDAWFQQTLRSAHEKNRPIFVVQHYSLYLKTPDEADGYWTLPLAKRPELLKLYTDCGVVAVLCGHLHETLLNTYQGIALVTGGAVGKNLDNSPIGFRLWHVDSPTSIRNEFVPLMASVDADSDEQVGLGELCRLTGSWLSDDASVDLAPEPYGDGLVNFQDLAALAKYWRRDLRLLGHWMLDETEGSVAHDGTGGNDGTANGNPVWKPAAGQVDGALQFDGIDDYVDTQHDMNPGAGAFSVFAWVPGWCARARRSSRKGTA